jgi:hypothetical protein
MANKADHHGADKNSITQPLNNSSNILDCRQTGQA